MLEDLPKKEKNSQQTADATDGAPGLRRRQSVEGEEIVIGYEADSDSPAANEKPSDASGEQVSSDEDPHVTSESDIEEVDLSDPKQLEVYVADIEAEYERAEKMGRVFAAVSTRDEAEDVTALLNEASDAHSRLRIAHRTLTALVEKPDRNIEQLNTAHDRFGDLYTQLLGKYRELRKKKPELSNVLEETTDSTDVASSDHGSEELSPKDATVDDMVESLRLLVEKNGASVMSDEQIVGIRDELNRTDNPQERFERIKERIEGLDRSLVPDTDVDGKEIVDRKVKIGQRFGKKLPAEEAQHVLGQSVLVKAPEEDVTEGSTPEQLAYTAVTAAWQEKRQRYKDLKTKYGIALEDYYRTTGGKERDGDRRFQSLQAEYQTARRQYFELLEQRRQQRAELGIVTKTGVTEERLRSAAANQLLIGVAQQRLEVKQAVLQEKWKPVTERFSRLREFREKHPRWAKSVRAAGYVTVFGVGASAAVMTAGAAPALAMAGTAAAGGGMAVGRRKVGAVLGGLTAVAGVKYIPKAYQHLFTAKQEQRVSEGLDQAQAALVSEQDWEAVESELFAARDDLRKSQRNKRIATYGGALTGAIVVGGGAHVVADALESTDEVVESAIDVAGPPQPEAASDFKPFDFEPQTAQAAAARSSLDMHIAHPDSDQSDPGGVISRVAENYIEPIPEGEAGPEAAAKAVEALQDAVSPAETETYTYEEGIAFPVTTIEGEASRVLGAFNVDAVSVTLSNEAANLLNQAEVDDTIQQILMAKGEALSTISEDQLEAQVLSELNTLYTTAHPELEKPVSSIELRGVSYEPAVPTEVDEVSDAADHPPHPLAQEEITVTTLDEPAGDTTEKLEGELPGPEPQYPPPQPEFDSAAAADESVFTISPTGEALGEGRDMPYEMTGTSVDGSLELISEDAKYTWKPGENFWRLCQGRTEAEQPHTFAQFEGEELKNLIGNVEAYLRAHPDAAKDLGFPHPNNIDLVFPEDHKDFVPFKLGKLDALAHTIAVEHGMLDDVNTEVQATIPPPPPRPDGLGVDIDRPVPRAEGLATPTTSAADIEAAADSVHVYTATGGESLTDAIEAVYGEQLAMLSEYQHVAALDRITEILTANPEILKAMDLKAGQFHSLPEGSVDLTPLGILVMDEVHDRLDTTTTAEASMVDKVDVHVSEFVSHLQRTFGNDLHPVQTQLLTESDVFDVFASLENQTGTGSNTQIEVRSELPSGNRITAVFEAADATRLRALFDSLRELDEAKAVLEAVPENEFMSVQAFFDTLIESGVLTFDQDTGEFINTRTGMALVETVT